MGGRFGNQMFLYTFARLIATRFRYKLTTNLLENSIINNSPSPDGLEYINDPIEINDVDKKIGNYFPEYLEKRQYIIHGFFQIGNYYFGKEKLIQSFFQYQKPNSLNNNDIVAHIRLDDYKTFGPGGTVIDPEWYIKILDKEDFNKVYLVTDEPTNNDYFRKFKQRYNCEIISQSAKDDFYFLMNFKKIIIGNSTFSWWATMLGDQEIIYTFKPWIRNSNCCYEMWKIKNSIAVDGNFMNY
jgi:hypothetical protein